MINLEKGQRISMDKAYFVGIRTSKLLAIEIAYEILGSAATKPAAIYFVSFF